MNRCKIAIIGTGAVGSTTAYALSLRQVAADIVLIDVDEKRCIGELLDLSDMQALFPSSCIKRGNFVDAIESNIIIIAAGKRQNRGESRTVLYDTNKTVVFSICKQLQSIRSDAIVIMVTNPVDPLTYIAQQCLPLHPNQIFGSGTLLDSLRLRKYIGEFLSISPESINALVVGEHGDSQVALWSHICIDGISINNFTDIPDAERQKITEKTKNEAYEIIACKGASFFGIATCIVRLCQAIIGNERVILPVSCRIKNENICLSVPVVIGKSGINSYVPLNLSQLEEEQMKEGFRRMKQYEYPISDALE